MCLFFQFRLTSRQYFSQGPARSRAVPSAIFELELALPRANLDAFGDLLQKRRLFVTNVEQLSPEPSGFFTDEQWVHHHLAADAPATLNLFVCLLL